MTAEMLSEAIGMLDDDIISAADKARTNAPKRRSRTAVWIGLGSMAACAAIIASVAITNMDGPKLPVGQNKNFASDAATGADSAADTEPNDGLDEVGMDSGIVVNGATEDGSKKDETLDSAEVYDSEEYDDAAEGDYADTEEIIKDTPEEMSTEEEYTEESVPEMEFTEESVTEEASTCESSEPEDKDETEDSPAYDDDFIEILYNPASGPPMTYDDAINMLTDPRSGEIDSYYLFEVQRALTLSECEGLDGWDKAFRAYYPSYSEETTEAGAEDGDSYPTDFVVYEVKVLQDIITGEQCGDTMYIMSTNVSIAYQEPGNPPYARGERYTAVMMRPIEGSDIRRLYEVLKYDVRGGFAYSRFNYELDLPYSKNETVSVITSTSANPVKYTQYLPFELLCDFLREDWERRGISRHFGT
ncbi:MAG: hypothetical protein ACI4KA_07135 [Oscillospiraceae bacterium]